MFEHLSLIDNARFEAAKTGVFEDGTGLAGIGTLGEKTMHAVIKRYIEPDITKHEQKMGAYVVDVATGGKIFEIQTGQFNRLIPKLDRLLPSNRMTIVHPIQARKWLMWVDPDTGERSAPRLSPRRGKPCDVFRELYRIKPYLLHPNFSLVLLMTDLEEYRYLNGWSRDRKRGSHRKDRIPVRLQQIICVEPPDFSALLPPDLPAAFTSADFAKAAKVSRRLAQVSLNVLNSVGTIQKSGKSGRMHLYHLS